MRNNFKFGDILVNHYAGDRNPNKHIIFIRNGTKFIECIGYDGKKVEFYKRDHKLEKVGCITKMPLKELINI